MYIYIYIHTFIYIHTYIQDKSELNLQDLARGHDHWSLVLLGFEPSSSNLSLKALATASPQAAQLTYTALTTSTTK